MPTSPLLARTADRAAGSRYSLLVAHDIAEVRAAQRLRHRVFAGEMGAQLTGPLLDVDAFDEHCDHLVVREDHTGEIVGTYRMLPPQRAARAGGCYADTEFDLSALDPLRPHVVETGRSCVHPEHRTGAVISLVWAGIARYMLQSGHDWLMGCCSVPLVVPGEPDGALAAGVWDRVRDEYLAPAEHRAWPHFPWDEAAAPRTGWAAFPPLLRGYLRLGARVCGPPAHDPDFGVADLLVLLSLERVNQRYRRHFLGGGR